MTKRNIIKFEIGKIYFRERELSLETINSALAIRRNKVVRKFLCVEVTENTVTFKRFFRINKNTGEMRWHKNLSTMKVIGKRESCHKAISYTYYVDRQKYREFIFADNISE
tara:strand:- start:51 stop:383 length:333 start_codon:yes stop_codon:yes gene_type:complete